MKLQTLNHEIDIICRDQNGQLLHKLGICRQWYSLESAVISSLYSDHPIPQALDILKPYQEILLFSFSDSIEKLLKKQIQIPVYKIPPRPDAHIRIQVAKFIFNQIKMIYQFSEDFPSEVCWDKRKDSYNSHVVIIHPGSGSKKKNWDVKNFIELYHQIAWVGFQPMILLGPAEWELASEFNKRNMTDVRMIEAVTDLLDVLTSAGTFIGNDSGISHLAGYLGLHTIVIYGPSDAIRWKPVGRSVVTIQKLTNCEPCFEFGELTCQPPACFNEISTDMVMEKLLI